MPALCIVDMQPSFTAYLNASSAVVKQVELFKKYNRPIIVVEFAGSGTTVSAVANLLKDYKKTVTVFKHSCDGSTQTSEMLKKDYKKIKRVVVCGVNTCACVSATAIGLAHLGYKVTVNGKGSSCGCGDWYNKDDPHRCLRTVRENVKKAMEKHNAGAVHS